MSEITMKELLESGVHFGHQTRRWNPRMREYIFGERNGIHIIDLQKTLKFFKEAARFVSDSAAQGKNILFVGTKRQAQEAISTEAERCEMFYVNSRWLGGLLTNWTTVQKSIQRLKELEVLANEQGYEGRSKKEVSRLERERKHLDQNLRGIKNMPAPPDVLFVIDSNKEDIAVREANKLTIPVVAVVDTNSDPSVVDHVIPGNDDALRAIRLFTSKIADAVIDGRNLAAPQEFAAQPEDGEAESATAEGVSEAALSEATAAQAAAGAVEPEPTQQAVPVQKVVSAPEPKPQAGGIKIQTGSTGLEPEPPPPGSGSAAG